MDDLGEKILEYLRDLLLIKVGVGDELVDVPAEQYKVMSQQAQAISEQKLEEMINKFTQAYDYLSQAVIPSLPLEVAVIEVSGQLTVNSEQLVEKKEEKTSNQPISQTIERSEIAREGTSHPISKPDDQWLALMMAVKPLNHSVEAFLRSATGELRGKNLIISAFYPFHKERLEDPRNRKILETAVQGVYGKGIKIKVELKEMEKER
jgi:DNA polymerase III gamma/tau subunit